MTDSPTEQLVRRSRNILKTAKATDDASPSGVILRDLGLTLDALDRANTLQTKMLRELEDADLIFGTELLRLETIHAPAEASDKVHARLLGLHSERRRLLLQHDATLRTLHGKLSELLTKYALLAE